MRIDWCIEEKQLQTYNSSCIHKIQTKNYKIKYKRKKFLTNFSASFDCVAVIIVVAVAAISQIFVLQQIKPLNKGNYTGIPAEGVIERKSVCVCV